MRRTRKFEIHNDDHEAAFQTSIIAQIITKTEEKKF